MEVDSIQSMHTLITHRSNGHLQKKAGAGGAALGRKRRARAAGGKEDPDVIPFLASTKGRFKKGADLTSSSELTGFLGRAAKGLGRAFVGSSVFRFMAEVRNGRRWDS